MADGSSRPLRVEVLGDTGVHLGAGLYFGFDGHHHGEWRGEMHVEGERISNCADPEQARRLRSEHGVYMLDSSRINVAGVNAANIDYLTAAVARVL